jgi:hypothetical protein
VGGFNQRIALEFQNTANDCGLPKWGAASHLFGPDIDLPPPMLL